MKIFAIDDYVRVINSNDYKIACISCKFNMLENRLTSLPKVIQHIFWTGKKIRQWEEERPNEYSTEQYNKWLENKFNEYKQKLMI